MRRKQTMTNVQREAALTFAKKSFATGRIGQQPSFVIYDDGKVAAKDLRAICLGWFFRVDIDKTRNPILCQMVVTPERCQTDEKVQFKDKFIYDYLDWSVKSKMLSPYICRHRKEERKWFVPIALVDVPRNAPLLVSTHVRYLWDRHNNSRSINVKIIKDHFPDWSWEMVMAVSCCFSNLHWDEVVLGTYNGGHDPFGHASVDRFSAYARGEFDHKWMDKERHILGAEKWGRERGSISNMFASRENEFQCALITAYKTIDKKAEKLRWGGMPVSPDKKWEAVELCKELLEKRHA